MPPRDDITPWPAPAGAPVLLFGGSFDPPHAAHAAVASAARDAAMPAGAWLVFVPAARSPFKDAAPRAADHNRAEMLRLVAATLPRAAVWTDELDRAFGGQPSYWIDTVRRARRVAPDAAMRTLIGADQAVSFSGWREADGIIALAEPLVVLRDPFPTTEALAAAMASARDDPAPWIARVAVGVAVMPGSSTDYRLARDAAMLHPDVASYIEARGLYSGR